MKAKTKAALDNILDCMNGSDGGGTFVCLRALIEDMDNQAANGDPSAKDVLKVVTAFSQLINVARKMGE